LSNNKSWQKQKIFLLGPNTKVDYLRKIREDLQSEGYPKPLIMIDEKMEKFDGSLTAKFQRLLKNSDFIFSLFFHNLPNVSVNFELGFMTSKWPSKIRKRHCLLLEVKNIKGEDIPVDLSYDNPYLSSSEGRRYKIAKFKTKARENEVFYSVVEQIHRTIVDEIG